MSALNVVAALSVALYAATGRSNDAITLPVGYSALRSAEIVVDPLEATPAPADLVRPLNGIDGAPLAMHPEMGDLRLPYWQRPAGADEPDGAHVELIQVGPDQECGLSLSTMFAAGQSKPYEALDAHVGAALATRSAEIFLRDTDALGEGSDGLGSFVFVDVAPLPADPRTGDVRLSPTMTIPSAHYMEIEW